MRSADTVRITAISGDAASAISNMDTAGRNIVFGGTPGRRKGTFAILPKYALSTRTNFFAEVDRHLAPR
ncbi:MAG: hypothetical protein JWR22_2198 [Herminiimonas sp.]|nr:hypothetical protein [Herminiimonas sp.]